MLKGSQASPVRPSDKGSVEAKTLEPSEAVVSDAEFCLKPQLVTIITSTLSVLLTYLSAKLLPAIASTVGPRGDP
jgi:hypothetical protein